MINITNIVFPVYVLRAESIIYGQTGAVFAVSVSGSISVVDDRSIPGDTLGKRRIVLKEKLKSEELGLYNLKTIAWEYRDLLYFRKKLGLNARFIDSTGRIFRYETDTFVPLKFYKIKKIDIIKDKFTYLHFFNLNTPLKVCRPPPEGYLYGGVIHTQTGNVLYGYTKQRNKDTRIKV